MGTKPTLIQCNNDARRQIRNNHEVPRAATLSILDRSALFIIDERRLLYNLYNFLWFLFLFLLILYFFYFCSYYLIFAFITLDISLDLYLELLLPIIQYFNNCNSIPSFGCWHLGNYCEFHPYLQVIFCLNRFQERAFLVH